MGIHTNCESITRRDCLRLGLSALIGGGLSDALRLRALASSGDPRTRSTSCILIWMDGGPSHYETFDPKPDAPTEIRGKWDPIATKVPGVSFSQHMTRLATVADKLAIVRSIRHDQGNHGAGNHYMMTGAPPRIPVGCGAFVSFHPSLGSVTASERERTISNGLPSYFSIPSMTRSGGPNFLGARFAPFVVPDNPSNPSFRVRDVSPPRGLDDARIDSRRSLRARVDHLRRISDKAAGDPAVAFDEYYEQGYSLMSSPAAQKAFDINREDPRLRDAYGRSSFGQRLLLARRLVEAGVPFVTVNDGGWDDHFELFDKMPRRLIPFDLGLTTLIDDLDQRGLLETTLVIALGEFGRTPKINDRGGRDHWSNAMSVLFAGCGTPGGQVVGATDARGYTAVERILSPENFAATVYTKLGIDPGKIVYTPQGRPTHLVSDPTPIRELMG
jgi:hypothetical protein